MCSPQYVDTIMVGFTPLQEFCCTAATNPTNYLDSISSNFCTTCSDAPLSIDSGTSTSFNLDGGYCDSDEEYRGQEITFHIPLAESQVVDLNLSNILYDVDMWLFSNDCDLDNCLASSLNQGLEDEFIRVSLPAGDYYLVIDQKENLFENTDGDGDVENIGNDNLLLEIQMYDTKCSFAEPIACGDEISGDTDNGSNFIDGYDGFEGYTSTEQVYELTITDPVTINACLLYTSPSPRD